jgi:hypothetical protein
MYIEFQLPTGAGGQTASYALRTIQTKLTAWTKKYSIEYRQKIIKYTLRITFDADESYTLFALTWTVDPKHPSWTTYRLITDLNNKI